MFAVFLGASCPENYLGSDGRPADISIYDDWAETNSRKATMENIFQLTHDFIDTNGVLDLTFQAFKKLCCVPTIL